MVLLLHVKVSGLCHKLVRVQQPALSVQSFWYLSWVWQTDRQTDRQTEIPTACTALQLHLPLRMRLHKEEKHTAAGYKPRLRPTKKVSKLKARLLKWRISEEVVLEGVNMWKSNESIVSAFQSRIVRKAVVLTTLLQCWPFKVT